MMIRLAFLAALAATPAAAQTITIDRPDLIKLDQIIQTTIPPAYSGRLIEWVNEMVKRQAEKDRPSPPAQ
jgi:hypothetical protein